MTALATDLRKFISQRIERADEREIATVVSALCHLETSIPPAGLAPVNSCTAQGRFSFDGEGMVFDGSTKLTWSRENVPGGTMNWAKAKEACAALRLGGFSDWRLPTIQELLTLVDYDRHGPAINTDFFSCESNWYWTSTPAHSSPGVYAWIVGFSYGLSYWDSQVSDHCVRAVRASQ